MVKVGHSNFLSLLCFFDVNLLLYFVLRVSEWKIFSFCTTGLTNPALRICDGQLLTFSK